MKLLVVFLLILGSLNMALAQNVFEQSRLLGRGVNFGNALEAPSEGAWGLRLEEKYFEAVKTAGFNHIRLPVSWTHHTAENPPYAIKPEFLARVGWAIAQAQKRGLRLVLNVHHYDNLNANPTAAEARYLAMWRQLAERYKNQPNTLYFELLNEPHGKFNDDATLWNNLLVKALAVVRQSNPTRAVIVGPVFWNGIGSLDKLKLPADPNLIATVHFYDPFEFTHQGAEWVNPSPPAGVLWNPNKGQLAADWQNWSWDSAVRFVTQSGRAALELTYQKGNAGLYLRSDTPEQGFTQLAFRTNRALDLRVVCLKDAPGVMLKTQPGQTVLINLSECGSTGSLSDIMVQNNTAAAQPAAVFDLLELRGSKTLNLISDIQTAMRSSLDRAAEWGKQNNRPIYVGEFGSYGKAAEIGQRVAWTTFVRSELEKRGFSWAYWEFGAGFGAYDRLMDEWRKPLLEALVPPR